MYPGVQRVLPMCIVAHGNGVQRHTSSRMVKVLAFDIGGCCCGVLLTVPMLGPSWALMWSWWGVMGLVMKARSLWHALTRGGGGGNSVEMT